jgi:hypothetical protein
MDIPDSRFMAEFRNKCNPVQILVKKENNPPKLLVRCLGKRLGSRFNLTALIRLFLPFPITRAS